MLKTDLCSHFFVKIDSTSNIWSTHHQDHADYLTSEEMKKRLITHLRKKKEIISFATLHRSVQPSRHLRVARHRQLFCLISRLNAQMDSLTAILGAAEEAGSAENLVCLI